MQCTLDTWVPPRQLVVMVKAIGARHGSSRTRWRSMALLVASALSLCGCSHDDKGSKSTVPRDVAPALTENREALVGFDKVALVAADGATGTPSPDDRRPRGTFYFRPSGSVFEWFVFAQGLRGGRAYQVELNVDGTVGYAIASSTADSTGRLGAHGAFDEFADRLCHRGDDSYAPPHSMAGPHEIDVRVKDDGSPSGGNLLGRSLTSPSANGVPCIGNGDGSFAYRLFAQHAIQFRGDSPAGNR